MTEIRDEFLSEEDLDLRSLTDEELVAYWNQWLQQAQVTNEIDMHTYSHGVFTSEPPIRQSRSSRCNERKSSLPTTTASVHHA